MTNAATPVWNDERGYAGLERRTRLRRSGMTNAATPVWNDERGCAGLE